MQQKKIYLKESGAVWLQRIIDAITPIVILFVITDNLDVIWNDKYTFFAIAGGVLFVISAQSIGTYRDLNNASLILQFKNIIISWSIAWISLIVWLYWFKIGNHFSRLSVTSWGIVTPFIILLMQNILIFIANFFNNNASKCKVIIVGTGELGISFAEMLTKNKLSNYEVLGFFDEKSPSKKSELNNKNIKILGSIDELLEQAKYNKYDEIYICLPLKAEDKIKKILNQLTDTTITVKLVPDLFSFDIMHAKIIDFNGFPVFSIYDTPLNSKFNRLIKRTEDIILACIFLVLISPLMLIIALGIKITSQGPIFYRQSRIGWNGKKFHILKFRSMPANIEKEKIKWGESKNKTNTYFGNAIRRTSMDELPQLINVLKGEMSIVGPRPERDIFVKEFRTKIPKYMQKHMVKAGITGWAQINGWRGDTSLEKRIEFDLHYVNSWSIWLDIKIIFLTIFMGLMHKNAH